MSIPQQVVTSEFSFKPPKVVTKKKVTNKDKKKWVDNKPFFGGFNSKSKNKQSTNLKDENNQTARAGGFRPGSKEAMNKEVDDKNLAIFANSGLNNDRANIRNPNNNGIAQKRKKPAPLAGGFRINIKKKKNKLEELKKLKNLDVDIHDRWAADPIVKEVIEKHEEEIKRAGHNLSDKPISDIIPQKQITKLKKKKVHRIQGPMFEEIKSEEDSEYGKLIQAIPTGKIESVLNQYAQDIEEDELYYKKKMMEEQEKERLKEEELKAITDDCIK